MVHNDDEGRDKQGQTVNTDVAAIVISAEALQLRRPQHDYVELVAICVRSPIPWRDDTLDTWDREEMLVCVVKKEPFASTICGILHLNVIDNGKI
jgi:hypothetical protein